MENDKIPNPRTNKEKNLDRSEKANSNRIFYYLGAVAVVLLLLWGGGTFSEVDNTEESQMTETEIEISSENANYDDEAMWQKANAENTAGGYLAYLGLKNSQAHKQEAVEKLNSFLNSEGYVLFAEKENGTVGEHFFKYAYTHSGLPDVNDYLITFKARPVYNGIPSRETLDQKDYDTILENKIVLVKEVKETEDGVWIKVAYASQEVPVMTD